LESILTVLLSLILIPVTLIAIRRVTLIISVEIARVKSASASTIAMIMSTIIVLGESTVVIGLIIIVTVPIRIIIPAAPTAAPASCVVAYSLLTSFPRLSSHFHFFHGFVYERVNTFQTKD
jgi:hypothetical protein